MSTVIDQFLQLVMKDKDEIFNVIDEMILQQKAWFVKIICKVCI